ncbi:aminoglycoside 3'-phosphotransferase [Tsukamurella sp. 8F]|uniref:aminoglycoside 3'-phosphotransferase n=1 Tax=unclassified Tsukamurella TaxID=2633480 RepID=UPI0023B8EB2E|nr:MULTISPECIES: aminoglycoside 3'-phosphotransferase [unclassified Tsukamurella]MDF0528751.1 aminoglycoside 3'-phosphotransferase [Tsukamurella sp. 8J]MDF0586586.1 aminoglycoside 3'-phosphotransferase [Tsukamurella sp. 8F]
MTFPSPDVAIPPTVAACAGGRTVTPVWRNELGGTTFRIGNDEYLKWQPIRAPGGAQPHTDADLRTEAEKLRWARSHGASVPAVVGFGSTADAEWLRTAAIRASSAVDPRWAAEPVTAARSIGLGLRLLHELTPVADCPFSWSADERLARATSRDLPAPPPIDRLVVCHGDACAPNTLLSDDGGFAGHVDLGALGVGDRWADIAVATMSLAWNYPTVHEEALLDAYGVDPDPERTAFYRALWNAT